MNDEKLERLTGREVKITLLYVEDEEKIRKQVEKFLSRLIDTVIVAKDGVEGLELFQQHAIDVVVSDIRMPRMDGLKMIEKIKEIDSGCRVVITSAFNDQEYLMQAIELGVHAFLSKPIRSEKMIDVLESCTREIVLEQKVKSQHRRISHLQQIAEVAESCTHMGSWEYDVQSGAVTWSKEMYRIFGVDEDTRLDYQKMLSFFPESAAGELKETWESLFSNRESIDFEQKLIRPDGSEVTLRMLASLLLDEEGNIAKVAGACQDITEQVMLESLKRKHEKALILQDKIKSINTLLHNISHHWRQPLNVISLLSQLIEEKTNDKEFEDLPGLFDKIQNECVYLSGTIDQFHNIATLDGEVVDTNICTLLKEVRSLIYPELSDNQVEITVECLCEMDQFLKIFPNDLKRVLLGIALNAKDAILKRRESEPSHKGVILIHTEYTRNIFKIMIRDNGTGIDEAIITRVFEPYFTTKFESRGVGLSLYLYRYVIENEMSGSIEFNTQTDEGVEVVISLPLS